MSSAALVDPAPTATPLEPAGSLSGVSPSSSSQTSQTPGHSAQKRYAGFANLGLDIHLNILSYLQTLDILKLKASCRALAAATQHRCVWTNALKNALCTLQIPISSYEDVLKHAPISTLMGMASFPERIARQCRRGGKLQPQMKASLYAPEGHQIISVCLSPDARLLVVQSSLRTDALKQILSIWDLAADTQFPVLRRQVELVANRDVFVPQLGIVEGGVVIFTYHRMTSEEIRNQLDGARRRLDARVYSYATRQVTRTKWNLRLDSKFSSMHVFGSEVVLGWGDGAIWIENADDSADPGEPAGLDDYPQGSAFFWIPAEYQSPTSVYMSDQTLLLGKAGYGIFTRPSEDLPDQNSPHPPILELKTTIGAPGPLSSLRPLRQTTLPRDHQTKFMVEMDNQGNIGWSTFSTTTLKGTEIDLLPIFMGSTQLPAHNLCTGQYGPWEKGFIATVLSPLAVVMVEGEDPEVAHWVELGVPVAPSAHGNVVFSTLHGNVYTPSADASSVIIHRLFCRPPVF